MEAWIEQATDGRGMIIKEYCVAKPYGWFLYSIRKNGLLLEMCLMDTLEMKVEPIPK